MKRTVSALCLIAAFALPAAAFELPGIGKIGAPAASGTSSASVDSLLTQVQTLSGSYQGATKNMLSGREKVLSAFSLKDEAAKVRAQAGKVSSGQVTAEEVTAASTTMGSADEAIKKAISDRKKLGKDGKKQLSAGIKEMAAGLKADAAVSGQAKETASSVGGAMKGAGMADMPKLQVATELLTAMGTKLPVDISSTKDTLGICVEAAKILNVKVPAGVTETLSAVK
ncbi:MAG TPA: hypothetical protein VGK27_10410 [Candidatus Deferrimicrobiaceae bacterium]|jgi:hypothetical protein